MSEECYEAEKVRGGREEGSEDEVVDVPAVGCKNDREEESGRGARIRTSDQSRLGQTGSSGLLL